ncbi:MBL fold metallo-hydrolase [Pedobacter nyackensis]|uniref:MBL fold metallo-hydrolase n=1 Tax=Pedobacter nyackensis TaxID=475255 RepID=UPI002930CBCB|nr:MBL fold metallo-hydrolase [Pedobacter nyackensis]
MKIEQFQDEYLAHYSYAILSECEQQVVLIDPSRDPQPYYDFAKLHGAGIIGVIETHPHADFVSSHMEIHKTTGAKIYSHSLTGVDYPQTIFDEGAELSFGKIKLKSLHTPGHSPDSISIVLEHKGKDVAVFTGDTLFIGDCGRPDLRENAGNTHAKRDELARQMYHSLRDKLMVLSDDVLVYPAHGSGSLCGKALSSAGSGTIGNEKIGNWSLQKMTEDEFVKELTANQPFIPEYFGFDVNLNRKGAESFGEQLAKVKILDQVNPKELDANLVVIDARGAQVFKKGHLPNAFNLMQGKKFETWLGSIIKPGEHFYLTAPDMGTLNNLIRRTASIGYESFIEAAFISVLGEETMAEMPLAEFKRNPALFTIVDVRNEDEVNANPIFKDAIHIPLASLRAHIDQVPVDKPIVVHCAGGYRSAAGSSILASAVGRKALVYDLGEAINDFN